MSLDVFQQDHDAALDSAARNSATDFPAGFSDVFSADWNLGQYFGQSIARQNARMSVLSDIGEDLYRRTGKAGFLTTGLTGEGVPDPTFHIGLLNDQVAEYRKADPSFDYPTLTEDDIQARMQQKSRDARQAATAMNARERTWGGTFGGLTAGLASQLTDPLNTVALPLAAPEALGYLGTVLAWAAIAGGTQAGNELIGVAYRERVQPGYGESGEPAANILQAAVGGGAIGGGVKGLAALWSRYKTGTWARSVRDAGNVVESEAQIQSTNPFTDAAGETAHRDALSSAIDSVTEGRPVDVDHIITPEQAAQIAERPDSAAAYWESRLAEATPEERADLGATDAGPDAVTDGRALSESHVQAVRDDPLMVDAIAHDLDHFRAEHGDMQIPMGETIDADGNRVPLMRSVNDVLSEAERRESAANEIIACLMPEVA